MSSRPSRPLCHGPVLPHAMPESRLITLPRPLAVQLLPYVGVRGTASLALKTRARSPRASAVTRGSGAPRSTRCAAPTTRAFGFARASRRVPRAPRLLGRRRARRRRVPRAQNRPHAAAARRARGRRRPRVRAADARRRPRARTSWATARPTTAPSSARCGGRSRCSPGSRPRTSAAAAAAAAAARAASRTTRTTSCARARRSDSRPPAARRSTPKQTARRTARRACVLRASAPLDAAGVRASAVSLHPGAVHAHSRRASGDSSAAAVQTPKGVYGADRAPRCGARLGLAQLGGTHTSHLATGKMEEAAPQETRATCQ